MLLLGDCNDWLKEIKDESIDLLLTDCPYGIEFMGKDWDKALVHTETWKECYRVLKQGKLAFIMCSPRQDVLARMIINLQDAGFRTNYSSIYWTYASGFPKAANVSKLIDKREGLKGDIIGYGKSGIAQGSDNRNYEQGKRKRLYNAQQEYEITKPATEEAKKMEGAYVGFQPKPAVEVILVVSKGKTLTWLDDVRIPYQSEDELYKYNNNNKFGYRQYCEKSGYDHIVNGKTTSPLESNPKGRFPANLLVSDDVLNDGKITKSSGIYKGKRGFKSDKFVGNSGLGNNTLETSSDYYGDSGSYSRYFSLDSFAEANLPWLYSYTAMQNNNDYTVSSLLTVLSGRNQHKQLSPLGKDLYAVLLGRLPESSYDSVLSDSKLHTYLNHDVPLLDDILRKQLSQSVHNSLRKFLVSNAVLYGQNWSLLVNSLGDYQVDHRLNDALLDQASNLSPEFLLLLICVAEWNLSSLKSDNQGETHDNIYHQKLSYSYILACYQLINILVSYTSNKELPPEVRKTFPFLIVPKASKGERNKGVETIQPVKVNDGRNTPIDNPFQRGETLRTNSHPTVKPLKLMSYLITMGSREGDLVLDPFCGSGTVCIAADQLHRKWLGIEKNPEYAEIIKRRLMVPLSQLKLTIY